MKRVNFAVISGLVLFLLSAFLLVEPSWAVSGSFNFGGNFVDYGLESSGDNFSDAIFHGR